MKSKKWEPVVSALPRQATTHQQHHIFVEVCLLTLLLKYKTEYTVQKPSKYLGDVTVLIYDHNDRL